MAAALRTFRAGKAYGRKETLARLLAMRQALDILLLKVADGPPGTYSREEIAKMLRTVTR